MNRDLLKQFKTLKKVKASRDWKLKNRALLLKQINLEEHDFYKNGVFNFYDVFSISFLNRRFAGVFLLVVFFIFGGGFLSLKAAQKTKPGDSLYIAKIAKEKTQLAFTFDEKEKIRLGISFAGNRVKELEEVLKTATEIDANDKEKTVNKFVNKLINDFKKEVSVAKQRIVAIKTEKGKVTGKKEIVFEKKKDFNDKKNAKNNENVEKEKNKENLDEKGVFFSANLLKEKQGIQISEDLTLKNKNTKTDKAQEIGSTSSDVLNEDKKSATTTQQSQLSEGSPQEILKQVNELLLAEDYDASLDKLDSLNSIIDDIDGVIDNSDNGGVVKGISTSTNESSLEKEDKEDLATSSEEQIKDDE